MISGNMYFIRDKKKSTSELIKSLIKIHNPKNIKYVLVHPNVLSEKRIVDNIEIKPYRAVLKHHFWFISENNIENRPNYAKFEK
jgi:hypothetical protein